MTPELAKSYFHGKEGYNCAQAVLKAFQEKYQISDAMIEEYKQYGGGRVEGGTCGALYAALQLVEDEWQKQTIIQAFSQAAQFTTCERIKEQTLPCPDCVGTAAKALTKL